MHRRYSYALRLILAVVFHVQTVKGNAGEVAIREAHWQAYERGDYGKQPDVQFKTSDARNPLVHITTDNQECDRQSYVLLSPRGEEYAGNKALMLDSEGTLIWFHKERGAVNSLDVQRYRGQDYLTYWVGDDNFFGHGAGYFKMFDQSYDLAYVIAAGGDLDGDYHDFQVTKDDTAIITSYLKTPWDLTAYGREDGYIWDCAFQEIDIETNEVLFEWFASQHFAFSDMTIDSWTNWTGTDSDPWDWFHLNSVEKDTAGNFLLAARYTNAITYVSGFSGEASIGEVIWHLGGKHNRFTDLSDGNATRFTDPHMARWTSRHGGITVFDNVAEWSRNLPRRVSHGLKIGLDLRHRTAKVQADIVHPDGMFAASEGSFQVLENGNYFIGWGSASATSEFSRNGTILCNTHYSPLERKEDEMKQGSLGSYRVLKKRWRGFPQDTPQVNIAAQKLHVSWNGATELGSWRLAGRRNRGYDWIDLGVYEREGFETTIHPPSVSYSEFQLTALDKGSRSLSAWVIQDNGKIKELYSEAHRRGQEPLHTVTWSVLFLSFGLLVLMNRRLLLGR